MIEFHHKLVSRFHDDLIMTLSALDFFGNVCLVDLLETQDTDRA